MTAPTTTAQPHAAPDVVAPPPGHPRFPLFDALRAIAALAVLASHAGYTSGASQSAWYGSLVAQGIAGVTVFFVLSGFLLYRPFLAAELDGAPGIALRDYARRRVLRIVPAYWVALTVIALWLGLRDVFSADWWRYYLFLQIYDPDTLVGGLAAAWTLCVEVSFYAYLPFHAAAMRRLGRGRSRRARLRLELGVLAALAVASVAARALSIASGGGTIEVTLLGTFAWFALGMGLAAVSVAGAQTRAARAVARHPGASWLVAGVALAVLAVALHAPPDRALAYTGRQWMLQHVLSGVLAIALVAPAALGHERGGWPRRLLGWRVAAWLGVISYGIYLWQGAWVDQWARWGARDWLPGAPFLTLLALTAVASVACAATSYLVVERPLMRLKYRRTGGPPTPRTRVAPASGRAPARGSGPGSRR